MKIIRVLMFVCIAAIGQGPAISSAYAGDDANSQEQRRAELRAALKERNDLGSSGADSELASVKPPLRRYLSDAERADLRKQLRQQRSGKPDRP